VTERSRRDARFAGDLGRGFRAPIGGIAIAMLVMLPFTFALTLLVGWLVSWPSPVMILLAGLAQGVGTFWNAGWRMRTGADDGND